MTKRLFFSAFGLLALFASSIAISAELIDRIIAVVNQDVVMLSELRTEAQKSFAQLRQANTNPMPSRDQILSRALDDLIMEKLQLEEAERLGIEADQELVAKAIANIAENNKLTVPQLRQALLAEGQDFHQFQANVRKQILIRRLISREVDNRIQITTSEIDQYLETQAAAPKEKGSVHVLHILLATPDGASPQQIQAAHEEAIAARARIDKGEDFRAVAQAVSDGNRAIQGGDLGWMDIASLPGDFQKLVTGMKAGEVNGPLRSNVGFHILKVEAFRNADNQREIVPQTAARHILIRTNEITADSDAKSRLLQLRERIIHGDDFATIARSNSDDQASAIKGGELGWVSPGQMVPEFEEVLDETAIGDVSQPFKSRFGWHILQVTGRREHDTTEKARRDAAREAIRERKSKEATEQYKRRLRGEAYIDMRLEQIE